MPRTWSIWRVLRNSWKLKCAKWWGRWPWNHFHVSSPKISKQGPYFPNRSLFRLLNKASTWWASPVFLKNPSGTERIRSLNEHLKSENACLLQGLNLIIKNSRCTPQLDSRVLNMKCQMWLKKYMPLQRRHGPLLYAAFEPSKFPGSKCRHAV